MPVTPLSGVHQGTDQIVQRLIGFSWTHCAGDLVRQVIEHRAQELVLRAEVAMDKTMVDAGLLGDLSHADGRRSVG